MTHDSFLSTVAEALKRLNFAVPVYLRDSGGALNLYRGEVSAGTLPGSILPYVKDEKVHCNYFSSGEKMMVLYFIRFKLKKQKYVLIIQDNKKRTRLNRVVTALLDAVNSGGGDSTKLKGLQERVADLARDNADLSDDVETLTLEKEKLEEEQDQLLAELDGLKRALKDSRFNAAEHDLLKLWTDAAAEELNSLKESLTNLRETEERLEQAEKNAAAYKKDLGKSRSEGARLARELGELKAAGKVTSLGDNDKDEMLVKLQGQVAELQRVNESLKEQAEYAPAREVMTDEAKEKLDSLSRENLTLKTKLAEEQALRRGLESGSREHVELTGRQIKEKEADITKLQGELKSFERKVKKYETEQDRLNGMMRNKEQDIARMEDTLRQTEQGRSRLAELERQLQSVNELNQILRKNRDKLGELVNAVPQPVFTINNEDKIVTVNKALMGFRRIGKMSDIVGHSCHLSVYGNSERCSWCMIDQVRQNEEPTTISITAGGETSGRNLEITFFPVFGTDGTLIEVAEYIDDKTEMYEVNASLARFKEKMREFKRNRIEDINELNRIKGAFQELTSEHEKLMDRNVKMLKVIERLVSEDKARELMNARIELVEVRNKLVRSAEMIKNYKYQYDEQLLKYSNLNRRTFLQMERLLNILKGKMQFRPEETNTILSFLAREFDFVKKHFIEEEKRSDAKAAEEAARNARATESAEDKSFHSVEEKMLKEKLGSQPGMMADDPDTDFPPELHAHLTSEYKRD